MAQADELNRPPGLIASLGNIARNSMGLLLTRLELAALELSQVRNHLLQLVVALANTGESVPVDRESALRSALTEALRVTVTV